MGLRERIYNNLVRKNENVRYEYERYVMEHTIEHYENRLRHWKILVKLKWHYQVKKKAAPLLYWDKDIEKEQHNSGVKKATAGALADGPESEAVKRTYVHHIVKKYLEYDIVSFDVFDTLILRPFADPADLFWMLEEQLGQRDFHRIRMESEKRAREKAIVERGNREITIFDIYVEIERITGIKQEEGVRAEFELEKKLCFINPYMKRVLDILKSYEKEIYVVTDMYLPKRMLLELLETCGITGLSDIIVSCDYNCNKNEEGLLYKILLDKAQGRSVIHVGDNYNADIVMAQRHGLQTHYYKNVNVIGKKYRAKGMSELVGSGYAGIVNAKLHCGLKRYSVYYEYGYVYGGIYVLGFCNYIVSYCKTNHIDKVLFLARDGDIYSKVFEKIHPKIRYEYVYWSRMANVIATVKKDRFSFIDRFIDGKVSNHISILLSSLFKSAGLEKLLVYFKDYRVNEQEYLSKNNALIVKKLLLEHYDEIIEIYSAKEQRLKNYYRKVTEGARRVAIVDVGWTGSDVIGLSEKLVEEWNICDFAVGIVAACNGWNSNITTALQPYLFSHSYNRAEFDHFILNNQQLGTILFEIFTQSTTPSFKEIEECGRFKFDVPEIENYQIIRQIHSGILDFAEEYIKRFGEYPIMMNISGYDAYMPFKKVFGDVRYFKKYFSNMVFALSMFSDGDRQSIETLGKIILNRGL